MQNRPAQPLDEAPDPSKHPEWRRTHKFRRAIWNTMSRIGLTGMHSLPMNRRWIDIHRRVMPMQRLDPALAGLRIVQLSDIHYSPVVWRKYLLQYMEWVNDLEPDLVCVTGDLITGGARYADRVARVLAHLKPKYGVVCTLGNHDYTMFGKNQSAKGKRSAQNLEDRLESHGLIVLRNEVHTIQPEGAKTPLVIVGLDDLWSGHLDADKAYVNVDSAHPIICLNHNPVNCLDLMQYEWQWMLAGHTHGRQVGTSKISRRLYPKLFRHYIDGYYAVNGRHLYVNRGLSYGQRVKDWCKPEVTVFKLTQQLPTDDPAKVAATAAEETVTHERIDVVNDMIE